MRQTPIQQSNPPAIKTHPTESTSAIQQRNNIIFAIAIIAWEILTLPIYGVLLRLSNQFLIYQDYGGVLLMSISTILLIIGFGLINSYITRSSLSGMTFTLIIFVITIQNFFLFRAFWSKAGTNDYDNSTKSFSSWYDLVNLSNYFVDRQFSSLLPSGPFVEAVACAISMAVAFNSVLGRIGLLQILILCLFGPFFYQVNSQLIYRWFITDNGFGCRIFVFGSVLGTVISILLGKKQTTVAHYAYQSQYRQMSFALLGFLFVCISTPILSAISIFSRTPTDNAVLYATHINAWLAIFASVLGTFTASAFTYRKFSVFDLVFAGTAGAVSLAMQADINFNPCVPLIVGYIIGFVCSIYPAALSRKINQNGVIFTFPHINRFLLPAFFASVVSAIVQATGTSANGDHSQNKLSQRTFIQQGGWQIVGFLISFGVALLAGVIVGILIKILNNHQTNDQFNDEYTYKNVPAEPAASNF